MPSALMFAGADERSLRALIRHTGVPGALCFAALVHVVAAVAVPGIYAYPIVRSAARSGPGAIDLAITVAIIIVGGFAWFCRRSGRSDRSLQLGAAWICWLLALIKAAALALILALGLAFALLA